MVAAACHGGAPPDDPSGPEGSAKPFSFPPVEKIVNPLDPATHNPILVDAKGSCHVDGPHETAVPCPAELRDPEYANKCADRLVIQRGPTQCQCEVFGDPPYVGQVPCPKP
jgi:hypothetical protein